MPKRSAGILLYRRTAGRLEVLLVHPGGPFWRNRDEGAWTIPKGEYGDDEDPLDAARREFEEELGSEPQGTAVPLRPIRQKGGKEVSAWAMEGDLDAAAIRSNEFDLEWPPKSGRMQRFPEVDRAEWFDVETARSRINPAQVALIDELVALKGP
ncbi:MAG TPA: NUDIX domain-containing protein [Rhodothermales bacterium]